MTYDGFSIAPPACRSQMLRIQKSEDGDVVTFTLSGRIRAEHTAELHRAIEGEGRKDILLDLEDVNLVDQAVVSFLVRCQLGGINLANCPAYIREWILCSPDDDFTWVPE